jgi:hypothetical protein
VNSWYGLSIATLKALGLLSLAGGVARVFVAFAAWRTSFRNRLLGMEPRQQQEVS